MFALIAVSQHDSAYSARDREAALVAILSAPDARVVPSRRRGERGRVVVAKGRAALVSALRPPPAGRTYQAWGLPAGGGKPVPLPTFSRTGAVVIVDRRRPLRQARRHGRAERRLAGAVAAPFAAATL